MKQQAKTKKLAGLASLPVPVGTAPMEAKLVEELPGEPGWQFEPKWDGFRCLAFRAGRRRSISGRNPASRWRGTSPRSRRCCARLRPTAS